MRKGTFGPTITRRSLIGGGTAMGVCIAALPVTTARANADAEAYAMRRGEEVIAAANAGSSSRFRSLLRRHTNLQEIAEFVLGNYRSQLPSDKRSEYFRLFEQWLGQEFIENADQLTGSTFEVINSTGGPDDYVVNGRVHGGGRMPVSFRVRRSGSSFRVRDVNFGGIWLTIELRSTITRKLQSYGGDFTQLFSYLR
jgi:ABC-type transporter MlaC component